VRRRRLTAKHAFTAWAALVYTFLFLPILVMVVFAFNKPSPAALAGFHGSNVCSIPPTQIGNITVWNGFTACWFSAGLHDPTYIPAIRQVLFNASVAMLIIRARFVGMGDVLEEAAYDLGSGPLATFRQVTLPRLMPAIVAAALLSFTFSFDDYVVPAFTNGTTNTWPIVLYSAVRFGLTPAVNALATIMLGITLAAVIVTAAMLRRSRARAGPREEAVLPVLAG
jgi:ABC-type spermidine/putrescine transport system permease subunit II